MTGMVVKARVWRSDGPEDIILRGRSAWALCELLKAGKRGCTPIDQPAPRWSAYVFILRQGFGLDIRTIPEPHGGPFAGWHGRYVLQSEVELLDEKEVA